MLDSKSNESFTALEPKHEPREPRALSSEYHKARKQLMLWSAILLIWEFVGIDLEKAKEAGGNAGAIIGSLKSPQAVPWALLILVAYFLFKVTVEWYQCSVGRRRLRVSRIDFNSAWIVSLLAVALYVWQTVSHMQLADLLGTFSIFSVVLFFTGSVAGGVFGRTLSDLLSREEPSYSRRALLIMLLVIGATALLARSLGYASRLVLFGLIFALILSAVFHALRYLKPWLSSKRRVGTAP